MSVDYPNKGQHSRAKGYTGQTTDLGRVIAEHRDETSSGIPLFVEPSDCKKGYASATARLWLTMREDVLSCRRIALKLSALSFFVNVAAALEKK